MDRVGVLGLGLTVGVGAGVRRRRPIARGVEPFGGAVRTVRVARRECGVLGALDAVSAGDVVVVCVQDHSVSTALLDDADVIAALGGRVGEHSGTLRPCRTRPVSTFEAMRRSSAASES